MCSSCCAALVHRFFIYGGALNLHLPSIIATEGGKSVAEAASIYSIYVSRLAALNRRIASYTPLAAQASTSSHLLLARLLTRRITARLRPVRTAWPSWVK